MNLIEEILKSTKVFSRNNVFPRKSLLTHAQTQHAFNPKEFTQEELPPPPGAKSSTYEQDHFIEKIDPWIMLKFPDNILDMDPKAVIPKGNIDPTELDYIPMSKRKWDI